MQLINTSRRYFVFDNPDNWIFENRGIEGDEDGIKFPRCYPDKPSDPVNHDNRLKMTFKDENECVEWYEGNKMKFAPGKKMVKMIHDVTTKSIDVTDEDWSLIQARMRRPEKFKKEDFVVFEDWLANNWRDRDRDRFSLKFLRALNRTIPGKQRLTGHEWKGPGYGRYFKSRVEQIGLDEALEFIGEHAVGKMREHLEHVINRDGSLGVLVPSFYMRISDKNRDHIADLEAGIGGDSSIGFRADGREAVKDQDGNILYYEYIDNGTSEAMEGSDVWLGSQRGSQIKKDADEIYDCECIECGWETTSGEHCSSIKCEQCGGEMRRAERPGPGKDGHGVQIKPSKNEHACELKTGEYDTYRNQIREHDGKKYRVLIGIKDGISEDVAYNYNKSAWTVEAAKSHCKEHNGKFFPATEKTVDNKIKKVIAMKFKIESLGFEKTIDDMNESSVSKVIGELEASIAPIVSENVEFKSQLDALKEANGGEAVTPEGLKKLANKAKAGDTHIDYLVSQTNKYKVMLGLVANEEKPVKADTDFLKSLTPDQIQAQLDQFKTLWEKDHPPQSKTPDNTDDLNKSKDEKKCELDIRILA
jgi:hypothetical protein